MNIYGGIIEIIIGWVRDFRAYMRRECCVCHEYVPKGEGWISPSSFNIMHEKCFDEKKKQL